MKKNTADEVIRRLSLLYPNPRPALKYNSTYELLVAVILSAQCTDERVNKVTDKLFEKYDTPKKMLELSAEELERYIFSCGLYKNKAEHILSASRDIEEKYGGRVPGTIEELKSLAGVGVKTANVVFSVGFGGDAIAVDTHVFRVSNRIGLSSSANVTVCERDLQKIIDKDKWSKAHHYLIFLGRSVCKAQRPLCGECVLNDICEKNNIKR